jgi:hypothetical protein
VKLYGAWVGTAKDSQLCTKYLDESSVILKEYLQDVELRAFNVHLAQSMS